MGFLVRILTDSLVVFLSHEWTIADTRLLMKKILLSISFRRATGRTKLIL